MLAWTLEWGEHEPFLLDLAEEAAEAGRPPPAALVAKPRVIEGGGDYLGAFRALDPERPVHGGGVGYIPITAMRAYADAFGFAGEFPKFFKILRELDALYVDWARAKGSTGHKDR